MGVVEPTSVDAMPRPARRHEFVRAVVASRKASFGVAIVLLIAAAAILSPLLAPDHPEAQILTSRLAPPLSSTDRHFYVFGTDQLGRDILSRLIYGARIPLLIVISASQLLANSASRWGSSPAM